MDQFNSLIHQIDELFESRQLIGERAGNSLRIRFDRSERTQKIRIAHRNNTYQFTSVVARVKEVIGRGKDSRDDLLFRILCRNALKSVVFLYIDNWDRVVGQVTCPVSSADAPEIEFYLTTLARDCDQFEYILSGKDQH